MRILIATNSYPTKKNPTRQSFVKNLYEGLKNEDCRVDLVQNQYFNYFESDLKSDTKISSVVKVLFMAFSYLPYMIYKARKYDLIYSQSAILPGFFVMLSAKLHQTKYISYVHGTENRYIRNKGALFKLAKLTLQNSEKVITNSHYMKSRINQHYNLDSRVISPGYNSKVFKYRHSQKPIDLFFAGHAIKNKGIDILLKAVKLDKNFYRENNINVQIHCSGGDKKEYISFTESNNLTEFITFGDRLSENELAKHYRESKIVVFPSRIEALGLVGIEAISCGAFLIASNTGGIREYVKHGVNGYLFEKNNPVDLQHYIRIAYENYPTIMKNLAENSKTVKEYSIDTSIKETIHLIKETLDDK